MKPEKLEWRWQHTRVWSDLENWKKIEDLFNYNNYLHIELRVKGLLQVSRR